MNKQLELLLQSASSFISCVVEEGGAGKSREGGVGTESLGVVFTPQPPLYELYMYSNTQAVTDPWRMGQADAYSTHHAHRHKVPQRDCDHQGSSQRPCGD